MLILPLVFFIVLFVFFLDLLVGSSNPFVIYGVLIMEWIRFVLMPPFCALAGEQNGVSYIHPTISSLNFAVIFMIIEILAVSICCRLFIKKNYNINKVSHYTLIGNIRVYVLYFIFAAVVYFAFGKGTGIIRFLIISVGEGERVGDPTDTFSLMLRQIILCAFILAFVVLSFYSWKKYTQTNQGKYVMLAIFISGINLSIIVGERRSAQVYTLICSLWILSRLFPKYKKKIFIVLSTIAGVVLIFMSIYKFFGAFMYDSYSQALSSSNIDTSFVARTLQSYFFGPQNIAIGIDFFQYFTTNIFQLFFDFIRSIFGFNFLFKNAGNITSISFNSFIYGFYKETGHVLSASAYGYGFLGPIFMPVIALLNILIAIFVENLLYKLHSLELIYIVLYILTRFVTNLFVNTPPLINQATLMAFSCLFIIGIATLFNRKKFVRKEVYKWE